jgi:hypothetical protein
MRRIITSLLAGSLLATLAAGTVSAAEPFDVMIAEGGISVECFTTEDLTQIVISGEVTVVSGTGQFTLELRGHKPGDGEFAFLLDSTDITSTGPGDYAYQFTINASDIDEFNTLRVDAKDGAVTVNPEKSRSFKDECRTIIPEVPFLGLLLGTAALTGGLVVWRRSSRATTMAAA